MAQADLYESLLVRSFSLCTSLTLGGGALCSGHAMELLSVPGAALLSIHMQSTWNLNIILSPCRLFLIVIDQRHKEWTTPGPGRLIGIVWLYFFGLERHWS
jgi:hypothetical protein